MTQDLSKLFKELPPSFTQSSEYQTALTHKSYYFENKSQETHNERLEFLGDAALGLIVAKALFSRWPDKDEGFLTKARANLVNTRILAEKAKALQLESEIRTGKSERLSVWQPRVLASSLEALIGAMYLVLGEVELTRFIENIFEEELLSEEKLLTSDSDWKSRLQEELQKEHQRTPNYELVGTEGPDHQRKFLVQVMFDNEVLGQGSGMSRKEAEQEAARDAIEKSLEKAKKQENENGRAE